MPHSAARIAWTWLPLALYVALIFSLSSIQRVPFDLSVAHLDKLVHGLEYAIFAWLLLRALVTLPGMKNGFPALLLCWLLVAVVAAADEIYQSTVPGRDSSFWDGVADTTGAMIGSAIYFWFSRLWERRNRPRG